MATSAIDLPRVIMTDAAEALRAEVREFIASELATGGFRPTVDSWLSGVDPAFSKRLGERGWLGMTWPARYGGQERSTLERYVVIEELLAAGAPVAAHWVADRQSGSNILAFGSDHLKEMILPRIAAGECFFAIGMSEPDAGSDLASIRTRARRNADGDWVVSGAKIWTSNAQHCHYAIVLVRTADKDDRNRHAGMSQLVVDLASDGIAINPIAILDGTQHLNEVVFDDVVVPAAMLLGTEGDGWRQVTAELAHERSGPERFMSTFALLEEYFQLVRATAASDQLELLGMLSARFLALRELSTRVAGELDRGALPNVAAAMVKDMGTAFEVDSVDALSTATVPERGAGAGDGFPDLLRLAQLHAPGFTLRGGTNEVLRSIVYRGLEGA
ncbi:acyl-CoA dehydrogenase family protein [Dactylosporangium sp. NPDC051484]|uniref:acyl-CoA dehydrogenase family protein n=1 Tax=Dactylosporangium sp. NPDC051484 TaxID=3154942 RepID=UPI00344B2EB2